MSRKTCALAAAFLFQACAADPAFDRITLAAGQGPASVAIADVNHDGHPDLLVVNTIDRTLTVLLGDGKGHFIPTPGAPGPTGQSPNDLALGDFNGDGNLDVVIANTETPQITILLGNGKGGFAPAPKSPITADSHPHVHGLAAADFTGDGKLDIVTESWGRNQILLLAGDGAGNLSGPGKPFNTGKRPYQRLRSADFNKDGKPDVVTTNLDANTVSILLGDGKGGFQDAPGSPCPAGAFPWAVAVGDVNRDGNPDLAVVPYDRDIKNPALLGMTILLGNGKGAFRAMPGSPFSLAGCQGPDRIAIGSAMVVSCAQNNKLMIFRQGDLHASAVEVRTGWSGLAMGDLNGDGKDDIVVTNNTGAGPGITILFGK